MKLRIPVLLLLLGLVSCKAPASYEQFVRADQAVEGEYRFPLDLSDSTAVYDISLYTRVDPSPMASSRGDGQLGITVSWFSAGSEPVLRETVYLPRGGEKGSSALYRSGVKPSPTGEWLIVAEPVGAPEGLRGVGIICRKKNAHGTRQTP